ncbi:MAG TPA: hypothetical protein EYG68_11885 [Leucothrix mucor]|nr:hypothetical protein [Leucothrix mucor]
MNNNTKKVIVAISGLLIAGSTFAAGDAEKGKATFAESQCMQCHQSDELFTREDRKVATLTALDSQVRKCDAQLSTNLFDDEIEDVVAYLNEAYYKFPVDKKKSSDKPKETTGDK